MAGADAWQPLAVARDGLVAPTLLDLRPGQCASSAVAFTGCGRWQKIRFFPETAGGILWFRAAVEGNLANRLHSRLVFPAPQRQALAHGFQHLSPRVAAPIRRCRRAVRRGLCHPARRSAAVAAVRETGQRGPAGDGDLPAGRRCRPGIGGRGAASGPRAARHAPQPGMPGGPTSTGPPSRRRPPPVWPPTLPRCGGWKNF